MLPFEGECESRVMYRPNRRRAGLNSLLCFVFHLCMFFRNKAQKCGHLKRQHPEILRGYPCSMPLGHEPLGLCRHEGNNNNDGKLMKWSVLRCCKYRFVRYECQYRRMLYYLGEDIKPYWPKEYFAGVGIGQDTVDVRDTRQNRSSDYCLKNRIGNDLVCRARLR